eukprot:gene24891-31283_t
MNTTSQALPMPANRRATAYAFEIRLELIRLLRSPAFVLPVLLLPVVFYLLFAFAVAGEMVAKDPDAGRYMFAGFSLMAVTMAALFATCPLLAQEREQGLLTLKRAQPAPPGAWLAGKLVAGVMCGVLAYLPILIVAASTGQAHLSGSQLTAMSAVLVAGTIPFCALGVMLGSLVSGTAAPAYANLVYLPGLYLSGVFFPREQLPPLVRAISDWLPLTNAVELVRPLFMDQWPLQPLRHGLVLVATTVVAFWLALALTRRRFRG